MAKYQKTALVNVRIESRQRIPVGMLSLAACIKDKCSTVIFDPDPTDQQLCEIIQWNPDLVGIGFMTQTRVRARQIYGVLKKNLPRATFVLGGVGPSVEKEAIFEDFQPDALLVGEGEKTLEKVVDGVPFDDIPGLYRPGFPFLPAEIYQNLDDIPLPAYECMPDFKKYLCPPGGIRGQWFDCGTPMIMTGRGCPFACTFCSSCLIFGRHVRRRSPESVLKELRRLHDEYQINSVYFFDDTFTAPLSWTRTFCEALLKEPFKLTWGCQVRADLFNEDTGRLMKKAGCVQVDIGVESGSPKVLKALKKGETVEQVIRTFDICRRLKLSPLAMFLVGCPEETWEDVEQTKALLRRIKPSFAEFYYLIPYPGSELYRQALENGWLVDRSYEGHGMVDHPVMEINFTLEEQIRIRAEYFKMMSWRNLRGYFAFRVIWSVIKNIRAPMLKAFWNELWRTRNLRDAMQAYVHALRNYKATHQNQRPASRLDTSSTDKE